MFPYALELLERIGRERGGLLDEFVQKRVGIDEAPEVSSRSVCGSVQRDG